MLAHQPWRVFLPPDARRTQTHVTLPTGYVAMVAASPGCTKASSRRRSAAARRAGCLSTFADFRHAHWKKIWPPNPPRLNREIPGRLDVNGSSPIPLLSSG